MMKLLLATALTGIVIAANAHSIEPVTLNATPEKLTRQASLTQPFIPNVNRTVLKSGAKIGIARLEKGQLISAPIVELRDWAFLDRRSPYNFAPVSPTIASKSFADILSGPRDSAHQLDEIRMTASDLGMDYVLFYAEGDDARPGSLAGLSMYETGFIVDEHTNVPGGDAKAILVNTYSGKILGTVASDDVEFSIGDLTDKVEVLLNSLKDETASQA